MQDSIFRSRSAIHSILKGVVAKKSLGLSRYALNSHVSHMCSIVCSGAPQSQVDVGVKLLGTK